MAYGAPAKRTNVLAIISLVSGIAAFVLNWLLFLPSLAAVVLGGIALYQASKNPAMGGKAMAIIGIILGIIAGFLYILAASFFACLPSIVDYGY
jgi:hypothetical protein